MRPIEELCFLLVYKNKNEENLSPEEIREIQKLKPDEILFYANCWRDNLIDW